MFSKISLLNFAFLATTLGGVFSASVSPGECPLYPKRPSKLASFHDNHYGHRTVSYFVTNGLAVIDGDVIYGTVDDLLSQNGTSSSQQTRALSVFSGASTWPNAVIKYKYDSAATETTLKPIVDGAIARWTAGAPYLTWTKVANSDVGENGVAMIRAPVCGGCNSNVGYANGPRTVNLQQSCPAAPGTCGISEATHELGHLLGLYHEHMRFDREQNVHYNCANLDPTCPTGTTMPAGKTCCDTGLPAGCCGNAGNFVVLTSGVDSTGKYDATSLMHYRRDAFAKPGTFTLTPVAAGIVVPASNPSNPSTLDFQRMCKLYAAQCPKAKSCKSLGCPATCKTTPMCNKPSLCDKPLTAPPCCFPAADCDLPVAKCVSAGCDFLNV